VSGKIAQSPGQSNNFAIILWYYVMNGEYQKMINRDSTGGLPTM
jgi:hypothetical protein